MWGRPATQAPDLPGRASSTASGFSQMSSPDPVVVTVRHSHSSPPLAPVANPAEQMRELENSGLDRPQAAIWAQVLAENYRAVLVFLQICQRRAQTERSVLRGQETHAHYEVRPRCDA